MIGLAGLAIVVVATAGPAEALKQCQLALQFCAASGPVPMASMRGTQASGSHEYAAAQAAAAELADAARRLQRCAERFDFDDDCYREARSARSAADDYQAAADAYQRSER